MLRGVLLFALLCVTLYRDCAGDGCSQNLMIDNGLINPCAAVVDYEFYIPTGQTAIDLYNAAKIKLDNELLNGVATGTCKAAIVQLVCANTYLKCYKNVNLSDTSTYNFQAYGSRNIGIPTTRTCLSSCEAVKSSCKNTFMYQLPNCSATEKLDGSNEVMQYDSTNNSTFCHITKPTMIAQQVEKYNGYACSGYVQNYKTIPGNAINPTFSIMQSPGVTMSLMEKIITSKLEGFKFLIPTCYTNLQKMLCATSFRQNFSSSVEKILNDSQINSTNMPFPLNSTVVLPTNIPLRECLGAIKICPLLAMLPLFNCSASISGEKVYSNEQFTKTVMVSTPQPTEIKLISSNVPLYYNSEEVSPYVPQCPRLLQFSSNSNNTQSQFIPYTFCAVNCLSLFYTENEWHFLFTYTRVIAWIGSVLSLLGVIYFSYLLHRLFKEPDTSRKEDDYTVDNATLVVIYGLIVQYSFISLIVNLCMSIASTNNMEDFFCADSITPHSASLDKTSSCVIQGGLTLYCYVATLFICVYWYVYIATVLCGIKNTVEFAFKSLFASISLALLAGIPFLVVAVEREYLGWARNTSFCLFANLNVISPYASVNLLSIPVIVIVGLTSILFVFISYKLVVINSNASVNRDKNVALFAISMIVYLFMLLVFIVPSVINIRRNIYEFSGKLKESQDWLLCYLFTNTGTCGDFPNPYPLYAYVAIFYYIANCIPLIILSLGGYATFALLTKKESIKIYVSPDKNIDEVEDISEVFSNEKKSSNDKGII